MCERYVPLLVLHDFDKAGFSILSTLRRNTRRYSFSGKPKSLISACGLTMYARSGSKLKRPLTEARPARGV